MKKAIKNAMMILAGVSMIFAAAGSAAANDVVSVGGVQISAADFAGVKAKVAGEPSGDRVFAQKKDSVNIGPIQVARADFDNVKAIVAGDASLADAMVYAQAPEMVSVGAASVESGDYEAVKEMVGGGPVARLAQRIQGAESLN